MKNLLLAALLLGAGPALAEEDPCYGYGFDVAWAAAAVAHTAEREYKWSTGDFWDQEKVDNAMHAAFEIDPDKAPGVSPDLVDAVRHWRELRDAATVAGCRG